jgi:predicted RNA-binding Zn ribbon-like protein
LTGSLERVLRYYGFDEAANTLSRTDLVKARRLRARLRTAFEAPDERAAAAALLEVIRAGEWSRFGFCAAAPCCCVYLDRSKNRSRRYCCDLCADRVNQAAYRRRRRG